MQESKEMRCSLINSRSLSLARISSIWDILEGDVWREVLYNTIMVGI